MDIVPQRVFTSAAEIDLVTRTADAGQLTKAGELCAAYLKENSASVELLYLLGLIKDAAGDPQSAAECYRKVLYLEPKPRPCADASFSALRKTR